MTLKTGVMATENSSLAITEINNILIYIKVNIFILSVNSYFKQYFQQVLLIKEMQPWWATTFLFVIYFWKI